MNEIETSRRIGAVEEHRILRWCHIIPTDMRNLHVRAKPLYRSLQDPQPYNTRTFFARIEQELHAETDAKHRSSCFHVVEEMLPESQPIDPGDCFPERSHTWKNKQT